MGGEGCRRKSCRLRRPTDTPGVDFTAYPDRQDNAASDYGIAPDRCSPGGEEREYGFYKQNAAAGATMHPDLDASTNYHCLVFYRNVVPQSEPGHPGQVNDWLPGFLARNASLGTGHGNASSQQPTAGWAAPPKPRSGAHPAQRRPLPSSVFPRTADHGGVHVKAASRHDRGCARIPA